MNSEIHLSDEYGSIPIQEDHTNNPIAYLILAHGAGAPMNHQFMEALTNELISRNISVIRFNFPYVVQGRKFPSSPKPSLAAIEKVVDYTHAKYSELPLFYSGKSYGGRMGSHHLADRPDSPVKGIIYYGFPLHPPGKDGIERAKHLNQIQVPQLFIQGTNDKLANIELIRQVLSGLPRSKVLEIDRGDHSFKVPKAAGRTAKEIIAELAEVTRKWILEKV